MSLSSGQKKEAEEGIQPLDLLKQETELVRLGLAWASKHPELAPFGEILGQYMARRALTTCLGEPWSRRCRHCLGYLGMPLAQKNAVNALCKASMMLAYQEALRNPVQTTQLALKSVEYVTDAITALAELPLDADHQHKQLAALLMGDKGLCSLKRLNEAMKIYGGKNGEWLHLGLPHIEQLMHLSPLDPTDLIKKTYLRCKAWGQSQAPLVASARHAAAQPIYAPHRQHHSHAHHHHHDSSTPHHHRQHTGLPSGP